MKSRNIRFLLLIFPLLSCVLAVQGRSVAEQAFKSMPDSLLPILDSGTRLDMLDYFNSGMATPSNNVAGGKSRVMTLTPDAIDVRLSCASWLQIAALASKSDTLILAILTVDTPAPDSRVAVYSRDWLSDLSASAYKAPELKDWLTEEGRRHVKEIRGRVPFLITSASFTPASGASDGVLTLTLGDFATYLSTDDAKLLAPWFKKEIKYRWTGKKFQILK